MKTRSEGDMDEQIQELKTITRLQGEPPLLLLVAAPQRAQGLQGAGLSKQGQSRANRLVDPTTHPQPEAPKGACQQGAGVG